MNRQRTELKGYFRKGAIPTESNFADLIDSGLNQLDDGVFKNPNDPLSIRAVGPEQSLLNFYRLDDQGKDQLSWSFKQNPNDRGGFGLAEGGGPLRLFIESGSGKVELGSLLARGNFTGPGADYPRAQFTLSGGGTVSWEGVGGRLKWTNRFIAIAMGGTSFPAGHVNIRPIGADIPGEHVHDGQPRSVTADGVVLNAWEALYAVHATGEDENRVGFRIVTFFVPFVPPSNWILVAVVNGDDGTVKLGTGAIIASRCASTSGSGVPKGTIVMWSGDVIPDGWALCDGRDGRPDLRGRFALGAGAGRGLSSRDLNASGGEERHQLAVDELPAHSHGVADPGHAHVWSATRQRAGTDDFNDSSDFSKGDRSTQDTVRIGTTASLTGIAIANTGGNKSHENMPPFWVLAYIIKL